jgi:mRNA interferase MazF
VTHRALEPTQLLVEVSTPEGQLSGLRQDSVVNCVNIVTLEKTKILRRLGALPDSLLQQVNACLMAALGLVP